MTTQTKEQIQFLLIQYLEGKASPAERDLLSQYLTGNAENPENPAKSGAPGKPSESGAPGKPGNSAEPGTPADEDWMELMEELMTTEPSLNGYDPESWQPFVEQLKQ